jgi:tRNA-2-methylthio-N6-dimethylallyladenosine synthase
MEDKVTLEEKEQRLYKLNELVNDFSLKANKKYLGKTVPVLIEGINEKDDTKVFGYTDTMKLVNVEGCLDKIGKIIDVEITDAKSFSLDGKEKKS